MKEFSITNKSAFRALQITESLRTVLDPELQINVVDMGLIYHIDARPESGIISVQMTLSSSHCPMGKAILKSVQNRIEADFPGAQVDVQLVWEPQWTYENITPEGLKQLGR
ncbi:metal-sulfur cluster assembly factor [Arcticibacter sp.]|uniref:metal-sulfur cluster assembly factor n=1 Tax=Arcticibacter sp. TaxID=1872630 RepID=UPI00388DAB46